MFQKRILNAGVTAREMQSSIATFWQVIHVLRAVPKAPEKIVPYIFSGSSPVVSVVTSALTMSARIIASARMPQALYHGIVPRLTM